MAYFSLVVLPGSVFHNLQEQAASIFAIPPALFFVFFLLDHLYPEVTTYSIHKSSIFSFWSVSSDDIGNMTWTWELKSLLLISQKEQKKEMFSIRWYIDPKGSTPWPGNKEIIYIQIHVMKITTAN